MKNFLCSPLRSFIVIFLFLMMNSCATGIYLKTEEVKGAEISGNYTLILYGGRYSNDIENVAIFYKEGDKYTFEVYAPEFDYKIKKGVPAEETLVEAERFIRFHHSYWRYRLSRIIDITGNTIGYELKPLYYPSDFGYADVLDVNYIIKGSKVIVTIKLIPEVEKTLFDEDRPLLFRGIMRRR